MDLKKMLLIAGWVVVFIVISPVSHVTAGVGPEPPDTATITGPEIWGEVVMYCSEGAAVPDVVTIRVKRVNDCVVETQALIEPNWGFGCSDDPNAPLKWSLPQGTTFWDILGTPFISRVKNYKKEATAPGPAGSKIYSFDAQFKFWR
jgi:hypothetical protein